MTYQHIRIPPDAAPVTIDRDGCAQAPDRAIIPFIEGDGIGIDVTPVMRDVLDAAVGRAYGGKRTLVWMELFAGEKAAALYGSNQYLPEETLDAMRRFVVSIKGPLATPIGGGIRSLNVAIRQVLDLYACVRPVQFFPGVVTPMLDSGLTDMVIFRENTEDIYAGIEWAAESEEVKRVIRFLREEMHVTSIRFPDSSAIGVKPVSREGSKRLVRRAIRYAVDNDRVSVTLVHKGNIMKYTEGAFRHWGYEVARDEFGAQPLDGGPWLTFKNPRNGQQIVVKDVIADNFLQQILLRPEEYDVIATLNLNGDYISDALAAQVGGIGIAPGANIADDCAVFEATHGTAPGYAGKDRVNPGSLILSGEMLLRFIGWNEAADLVIKGVAGTIANKVMTYDLARLREAIRAPKRDYAARKNVEEDIQRLIPGATLVGTTGFGESIVKHME